MCDHTPASSAKVKNDESYTVTLPYVEVSGLENRMEVDNFVESFENRKW